MRNRIKQLEEENKTQQQTLTSEEKDKIKMLEESLIRTTLDKVSLWSTELKTLTFVLKTSTSMETVCDENTKQYKSHDA